MEYFAKDGDVLIDSAGDGDAFEVQNNSGNDGNFIPLDGYVDGLSVAGSSEGQIGSGDGGNFTPDLDGGSGGFEALQTTGNVGAMTPEQMAADRLAAAPSVGGVATELALRHGL